MQINIFQETEVVFIRICHFVNVYKPSHKKSHFSKNRHILQNDNHFQW